MTELKRVLVANRGEIALRIIRAAHDAGMTAVAVYAVEDGGALHARAADDAVRLDGPGGVRAYLDVPALLAAADRMGADAVHPGYGFLAESATFARAVTAAGLTWIGPPAEVIDALGDKIRAREIAARVGAPMAPGSAGPVAGPAEAVAFAQRHGLPVAIKAAHGGGGRGLRVVRQLDEVAELFEAAAREAAAAFGRGECFVESYVEGARHVEAQVLADQHGTVLVVGTRDCTLQRRYQKLVEEAPAPFLTEEQRGRLERAAAAICRETGYVSAATVEFLLSPRGELSFLEVNTRLQVEHTVTEEVTGLDLVAAQFRIAAGHPLAAPAPAPSRHAIEFRVNAEDPDRNFAPSTGTITGFSPPGGPGVRLDAGVAAGAVVSGQFDSLLAKLIVSGRDRDEALRRARRALDEFEVQGVRTTLPFLRAVLDEPGFTAEGPGGFTVHTRWIAEDYLPAAAARVNDQPDDSGDEVAVQVGGRWLSVRVPGFATATDEPLARAREQAMRRQERAGQAGDGLVAAPMQGTVALVAVAEGEEVAEGQLVAVVEAMKMENPLLAPHAGRVWDLRASVGQTVTQGTALCRIVPDVPQLVEPSGQLGHGAQRGMLIMGRVEGKVAFITGAARGQGRSHAIRLAEEGADIIAVDLCEDVETIPYPGATEADLAETVRQVEALDRRIVAAKADVRDDASLKKALDDGVAQLGRLDIVSANAGIGSAPVPAWEMDDATWQTMLDVNLTGVWRTTKAAIPILIEQGTGGSIILTSSAAGLQAYQNIAHYVSAKHGVVGLMRTLALELAPHFIRVNSVHPTQVDTPMIQNEPSWRLFCPGIDNPTREDFAPASQTMNALPIPWVDAADVSNVVLFLASDEARYVTGITFPVDAGAVIK